MKLIDYYIAIFAPILIIVALSVFGFTKYIALFILAYYVYRCFLDYYKLKSNGVVGKPDLWKFVVPIWSFIYFRKLYFE